MQYTVLGDAVNTAARLESRADPGQILISDSTRRNIAGGYRLKSIGALELTCSCGKASRHWTSSDSSGDPNALATGYMSCG